MSKLTTENNAMLKGKGKRAKALNVIAAERLVIWQRIAGLQRARKQLRVGTMAFLEKDTLVMMGAAEKVIRHHKVNHRKVMGRLLPMEVASSVVDHIEHQTVQKEEEKVEERRVSMG